jgi:hypothetical protein|eukprot:COSAG06_NODE_2001_length_7869_cov_25.334363_8_plen_37_part_00
MLLKLQATPELPDGAVDLALENGNAYVCCCCCWPSS